MTNHLGMRLRRPDNQLKISEDNYAVPTHRTIVRTYNWWKILNSLASPFTLNKDEMPETVLYYDFITFRRKFLPRMQEAIHEYEEKAKVLNNKENSIDFIKQYALNEIKNEYILQSKAKNSIFMALQAEYFDKTPDEEQWNQTRLFPTDNYSELLRILSTIKPEWESLCANLSANQLLEECYPKDAVEFIDAYNASTWSEERSIKRICIEREKQEKYFEAMEEYWRLDEILTDDELASNDRKGLYLDRMQKNLLRELYHELSEEDPLFQLYLDKYAPVYTPKQYTVLRNHALENYQYNMLFFSSLDKAVFQNELMDYFTAHPEFHKIDDLHDYQTSGIYVMVLGEYSQIYIGVSKNIFRRIQQHWNYNQKPLDRLIMGDIKKSKLSIDSFCPLDTTEIYVKLLPYDEELFSSEEKALINNSIRGRYILNRTEGGLGIQTVFRVQGEPLDSL